METVSIVIARAIWLINLADLNPKGLRLVPDLSDALTDAYDFDEQPEDAPFRVGPTADSILKFKNGQFETESGLVRVGLDVYDDGLVAETSVSTDVSEQFLEHVLYWSTSFGLRFDAELIFNKVYVSEVVVRFASPVLKNFAQLNKFSDVLTENAPGFGPGQTFSLTAITFGASLGTQQFSVERRNNSPADANVFYSKSSMKTSMHLRMLSQFEQLLSVQ